MSALTKILIVLQLVFSVAVSVLLVLMISRQENYKSLAATSSANYLGQTALLTKANSDAVRAGEQIAAANNAKAEAEQSLAKERADKITSNSANQNKILGLEGDKRAQDAQIQALTAAISTANQALAAKDKELEALRPQVADSITKNNDLTRRNNEMENQIRAQEMAIRKLQEAAIVSGPASGASIGSGGTVQMMSNAPAASAAVNAKITDVRETSGRTLVEMPLGSRDGITENTQLFIYRSTGYVGDAIVQRVTPTASVAIVTKTKDGQTVQAGDTISTINGK